MVLHRILADETEPVIVEFGKPYKIPEELGVRYGENKRESCGVLLQTVEKVCPFDV